MALTVVTPATTRRLTHRSRVQGELGISSTTDSDIIDALIDHASAAIEAYCRRSFARESVTETLGGYGDTRMVLARGPVVSVSAVSLSGTTYTDYSIEDVDVPTLYRQGGWAWTSQYDPGFSGWQSWPGVGFPISKSEQPDWSISYVAGYILASQGLYAVATVSASQVDNSFNSSVSGFPSMLVAGDIIQTTGFTNSANNGRFIVSGTPTTAKIVVTSTLVTESAPASSTVTFEGPTAARPVTAIERACIDTVRSWYLTRKDDVRVVEKQIGSASLRFNERTNPNEMGLPVSVAGLLRPWVRWA